MTAFPLWRSAADEKNERHRAKRTQPGQHSSGRVIAVVQDPSHRSGPRIYLQPSKNNGEGWFRPETQSPDAKLLLPPQSKSKSGRGTHPGNGRTATGGSLSDLRQTLRAPLCSGGEDSRGETGDNDRDTGHTENPRRLRRASEKFGSIPWRPTGTGSRFGRGLGRRPPGRVQMEPRQRPGSGRRPIRFPSEGSGRWRGCLA